MKNKLRVESRILINIFQSVAVSGCLKFESLIKNINKPLESLDVVFKSVFYDVTARGEEEEEDEEEEGVMMKKVKQK